MKQFTVHSADVEDLAAWQPDPSLPWEVNIQVLFEGESFQFQLRSLAWLQKQLGESDCLLLGRSAICKDYSYLSLISAITKAIELSDADNWEDFARQLNWYMQWEFENYKKH